MCIDLRERERNAHLRYETNTNRLPPECTPTGIKPKT